MENSRSNAHVPPLVAHVVYQFSTGGVENGVVNLVNHMSDDRYRHAVVSLTDNMAFRTRLQRKDQVQVVTVGKRHGQDWGMYRRFWNLMSAMQPAIIHTRNLPAMELQIIGCLAGVRGRIHGEHGRDMYDLEGRNRKYNLLRRLVAPCIHRYVTVSQDLNGWLIDTVGIAPARISQIYNGVDTAKFSPRRGKRPDVVPKWFATDESVVIGTVGRMQAVKDQVLLAKAFVRMVQDRPEYRRTARLMMVGDGPLRQQCLDILEADGVSELSWLPGERNDIPELMRACDLFVLPSRAEGISNTILEAMATGMPVVATNVGGNAELVVDNETGRLVPSPDMAAMATALAGYVADGDLRRKHGQAGRARVEACFSLDRMVKRYVDLYDAVLARQHAA